MRAATPTTPALLVAGLLFMGLSACQPKASSSASEAVEAVEVASEATSVAPAADNTLATDEAKASYMMGYGLTRQATGQFADVLDQEAFIAGVRAELAGEASAVSQEQARASMATLSAAQQAKQEVAATNNRKAGAKFLADNASKEGVVTTASGLQYLVLTEGEGPKPTATQVVKTHYQGTLINGEVFDSSLERGEPATFPLSGVIKGWTEALQLMSVGSKYRLFIPPELAYGNQATGSISPQSTLIFEVELLEIMSDDGAG